MREPIVAGDLHLTPKPPPERLREYAPSWLRGLRHIRIHDLRHMFPWLLLQQDESIVYVKEQLGTCGLTREVSLARKNLACSGTS